MNLISPKFLQTCQNKRKQILTKLFVNHDIFGIVMVQKGFSFEEACQWVAEEVFDMEVPLASESEIQMIRLASKKILDEMKENL